MVKEREKKTKTKKQKNAKRFIHLAKTITARRTANQFIICPRKCYAYAQNAHNIPEHVKRATNGEKGAILSTHLIWAIDKYRVSDVVFLFIHPNKRQTATYRAPPDIHMLRHGAASFT